MLSLFRKINYEIEKRKFLYCLKETPEDIETRVGLVIWHMKHRYFKQAFEQYKLVKDKYSKGSRLEELLKAKEILKNKGYEV
jgi:hypothetical protein